jgi:hypothetical protein
MKTIEEIEKILMQAFNIQMFYDHENMYQIEFDDIRNMIYYTGCYKNLNDLTIRELQIFCDHAYKIRKEKENESI